MPGKKILVHGGGKLATRLSEKLGVKAHMIEGRRVTDRETLDIVTMVYAGLVNKNIVAALQSMGCDAIGLSGADGNVIPASKRPAKPIDFGFVGDINPDEISAGFLQTLLDKDITPVFCAICHDWKGTLLNCNADTIAASVAIAASKIGEVTLNYCFEKRGVLSDIDDESSVIPLVTKASFDEMKESGVIAAGMIPKIHNALQSVEQGVKEVRICSSDYLNSDSGTWIK